MSTVAVIGAGASGIIAALKASSNNQVILIDGNDKCGKKILLTGNGRCNYWNSDISLDKYETDSSENLGDILSEENKVETLEYLDSLGLYPKIKNGYYYPYSNQAASVREILEKEIKKSKIDLKFGVKVKEVNKANDKFSIVLENNATIIVDKVIVATGSKVYPKTGSDGLGYDIAKKFGHKVNSVTPALTQLLAKEKFLKDWENVRCDAKVSLIVDGKNLKEDIGEIQLTANGISGICTFNISGLASKNLSIGKKVEVIINFMPQLEGDFYGWMPEQRLKRQWRSARDSARTPVQWSDEKNAGFSTADTTWISVNKNYTWLNAKQQEEDPSSILNFYRRTVKLRKQLSCVRNGIYQEHFHNSDKFYMYSMEDENQKILVICSFSEKDCRHPVPKGFDMEKAQLVLCNYEKPTKNTLHPYECKVYLWK